MSRVPRLGLEGIMKFDVLVIEKFVVEHFAISSVQLGKRCRSLNFYNQFVHFVTTLEVP